MCCFLSLDALFSLWTYILKRRGLKEVAGVCGVCGQSHDGCAKASEKHIISCKLCALKTINCLFLGHDWSWLCFSYFLLLPCSFQSWRWCNRSLPFVSFLAAFLLWVPSLHSKDQRLSFFIWSSKRWGETISPSYLIQQSPLCFGWEAFPNYQPVPFQWLFAFLFKKWPLFCFFNCDLSWNISLHFLILQRFSLGCRFSKLFITKNLPFCNCFMQLVFSCMRHLQLKIRPVT